MLVLMMINVANSFESDTICSHPKKEKKSDPINHEFFFFLSEKFWAEELITI